MVRTHPIFRELGHPLGVDLVERLVQGAATTGELSDDLGRTVSLVSKRLNQLARLGVIKHAGNNRTAWEIVASEETSKLLTDATLLAKALSKQEGGAAQAPRRRL